MCGEYGGISNRPHYHAVIFGHRADDLVEFKKTRSGVLWTSKKMDYLWGKGAVTVGDVTAQSAAYVASYCQKKITGKGKESVSPITGMRHYERIDTLTGEITEVMPEFGGMSLKPGIGASWLDKWETDALPRDEVVIDGKKRKVPQYYLERFKKRDESLNKGKMFRDVEFKRFLKSEEFREEKTPERLAVREAVAKAGFTQQRKENF
ncbi:MAG: replication initiator protein [Microvirus sp.]|nr:MAG: replication initiator protein [Microvirus sp.]